MNHWIVEANIATQMPWADCSTIKIIEHWFISLFFTMLKNAGQNLSEGLDWPAKATPLQSNPEEHLLQYLTLQEMGSLAAQFNAYVEISIYIIVIPKYACISLACIRCWRRQGGQQRHAGAVMMCLQAQHLWARVMQACLHLIAFLWIKRKLQRRNYAM